MRQRIENATFEALQARLRADECKNAQIREQWLVVALAWERVVSTFETIENMRDSALAAEIELAAKRAETG